MPMPGTMVTAAMARISQPGVRPRVSMSMTTWTASARGVEEVRGGFIEGREYGTDGNDGTY